MTRRARLLARVQIHGKPVSFFSPPHHEPDFVWVDLEELAGAFLPEEAAKAVVLKAQAFSPKERPIAMVTNGNRIATIACHAMAQAVCGMIDVLNGEPPRDEDEWGGGTCERAYCLAAGRTQVDYMPLSFDQIFYAFNNNGGPFTRGLRGTE